MRHPQHTEPAPAMATEALSHAFQRVGRSAEVVAWCAAIVEDCLRWLPRHHVPHPLEVAPLLVRMMALGLIEPDVLPLLRRQAERTANQVGGCLEETPPLTIGVGRTLQHLLRAYDLDNARDPGAAPAAMEAVADAIERARFTCQCCGGSVPWISAAAVRDSLQAIADGTALVRTAVSRQALQDLAMSVHPELRGLAPVLARFVVIGHNEP